MTFRSNDTFMQLLDFCLNKYKKLFENNRILYCLSLSLSFIYLIFRNCPWLLMDSHIIHWLWQNSEIICWSSDKNKLLDPQLKIFGTLTEEKLTRNKFILKWIEIRNFSKLGTANRKPKFQQLKKTEWVLTKKYRYI